MGVCTSSGYSTVHSVPRVSCGGKWKKKLSRKASKEKFIGDGSLPADASDLLVEFRAYIEEPLLLRKFAVYLEDSNDLPLLLCWADITEYKKIDTRTTEDECVQ